MTAPARCQFGTWPSRFTNIIAFEWFRMICALMHSNVYAGLNTYWHIRKSKKIPIPKKTSCHGQDIYNLYNYSHYFHSKYFLNTLPEQWLVTSMSYLWRWNIPCTTWYPHKQHKIYTVQTDVALRKVWKFCQFGSWRVLSIQKIGSIFLTSLISDLWGRFIMRQKCI